MNFHPAIGVFWEKGYDHASSRDLQAAMGIGEGGRALVFRRQGFPSQQAHEWHLQQPYAKAFFAVLESKLPGEPSVQRLEE